MNIIRDPSTLEKSGVYVAPSGFHTRPVQPAKEGILEGDLPGRYAGLALAGPPPRQMKDIIFTTGYAKGEFPSGPGFWDKGGAVRYTLWDPVSSAEVYQWHSGKGGQGEGY